MSAQRNVPGRPKWMAHGIASSLRQDCGPKESAVEGGIMD